MNQMKATCDPCDMTVFLSSWVLHENSHAHKLHVKNPRKKKEKVRQVWSFNFDEDFSLEYYMKNSRRGYRTPVFICDYCRKVFYKKYTLDIHVRGHCSSYDSYQCTICDEKFTTKREIFNHRKSHQVGGRYPCKVCKKKCTTHLMYLQHLESPRHLMKVELENMDEAERKIFKEKVRKIIKFTRGLQAVQNLFFKGFF